MADRRNEVRGVAVAPGHDPGEGRAGGGDRGRVGRVECVGGSVERIEELAAAETVFRQDRHRLGGEPEIV